jgi:transaldolase
MHLFLDTAEPAQIMQVAAWGMLDGVTTNPSHVARAVVGTGRTVEALYREILELVAGPVSLEAISTTAPEIVAEGRRLAALKSNVVVKVPLTAEGLVAVRQLGREGIKTNVTTVFSAAQALLAAKAGATYVSPFVGRLDNAGARGLDVLREIKTIFTNYALPTQILAAAMRHPLHVADAALCGAHAATMPLEVLEQLYRHPFTDAAIATFMSDWAKIQPRT